MLGSVLFHLVLLGIVLLLPPPFPSRRSTESDLSYVELKPVAPTEDKMAQEAPQEIPAFEGTIFTSALLSGDVTVRGGDITGNAAGGHEREDASNKGRRQQSASEVKQPSSKAAQGSAQPAPKAPPKAQPKNPVEPAKTQNAKHEAVQPAGQKDRPGQPAPQVQVAAEETGLRGVVTDRASVNFKYQKGWPAPGMVRLKVEAGGKDGKAGWSAQADEGWIIITPKTGTGPGGVEVGADFSKMKLGFYDGTIKIQPAEGNAKPCEVTITAMVLPKDAGVPDLPHSSFDAYMNGECKVCHLPKEVMPSADFMVTPEFCKLCHTPDGMAAGKMINGGHPVMVEAGTGGTKKPTYGRVPTGPKSDMMGTHLKNGRLVVCVTCHNVMEKPHDYGRTWEIASSEDGHTYQLCRGGWANMGYLVPRVYVTDGVTQMPRFLKDLSRYEVDAGDYGYDETDGSVRFKKPRAKNEVVYVTLGNPYLRVTTENNAICYDCHNENTHQGLNCMTCHQAHGTANIKLVRGRVRTGDGRTSKVVFKAKTGKGSFADGGARHDGICEVCHPLPQHKDGKDYKGTDCTRCHTHKNGFGS